MAGLNTYSQYLIDKYSKRYPRHSRQVGMYVRIVIGVTSENTPTEVATNVTKYFQGLVNAEGYVIGKGLKTTVVDLSTTTSEKQERTDLAGSVYVYLREEETRDWVRISIQSLVEALMERDFEGAAGKSEEMSQARFASSSCQSRLFF
jgi:hypothetical protein